MSFALRQTQENAPPPKSPPPGFVRAADLLANPALFSGYDDRIHKLQRVAKETLFSRGEAILFEGEYWFAPDARPDGTNTVRAIVAGPLVREKWEGIPIGFDPATENPRDVERVRLIVGHHRRLREFMGARGINNEKTAWSAYCNFVGAEVLKDTIGIKSYSQFFEWIRRGGRIGRGDISENRGGHEKPKAPADPQAVAVYDALRMSSNKVTAASAHRTATEVGELPSDSTMRARFEAKFTPAQQVMAREGEWEYKARCETKLVRPRHEIPAGVRTVLDGTKADRWRWVPCQRSKFAWIRPIIVVVSDYATGFPMGYATSPTENSEVTSAAHIMAVERYGAWEQEDTDNGKAFRSLLKKANVDQLVGQLGQAADILGFRVEFMAVKEAWLKPDESWFRGLKELDRLDPLWSGNFADTKPHDLKVRLSQFAGDPAFSFEHFKAVELPRDIETWANTPSAGCFGLSPSVRFEQTRGPIRRVAPELAKLAFSMNRMETRQVGEDGRITSFRGAPWGERQVAQLRGYAGKRVGIVPDPGDLGKVTVIDLSSGRPVCVATNERLANRTPDELREVLAERKRTRKADRLVAQNAALGLQDLAGQLAILRNRKAKAQADAQRALLPDPPQPAVTIVRPVLSEAAEQAAKTAKPAARRERKQSVFDRMADRYGDSPDASEGKPATDKPARKYRTPGEFFERFGSLEDDGQMAAG